MKSPLSAFPTWSTYIPSVGPVGSSGSVNYDLRSMFGDRGRSGTMRGSGDMSRAGINAARQLATAASTGAGVASQMSHRPILTGLERSRNRWARHDWAEDVGDRPGKDGGPGEFLSPPNLPPGYGSRVGWTPNVQPPEQPDVQPPEKPDPFRVPGRVPGSGILSPIGPGNDPQDFDREADRVERVANGLAAPRRSASSHGNPAATETARKTRRAVGAAADEVLNDPKLTARKRK